jgi:hypothetical protein
MAIFGRETVRDERRVDAYRQWFVRQHPFALASAVLSVFSLTHFGTLWADEIAGVVLGVLALRAVRRKRTMPRNGVRLAYLGIAVGILSLCCAVLLYTAQQQ